MRNWNFWVWTLTAVVVGVAMRLWYVLFFVRRHFPLWGDAQNFHRLGELLAGGKGYIQPFAYYSLHERVPTAEYPPLYPVFLAINNFVGINSPVGQRLVGCVVGGATVVMVGLLGRTVGGTIVGITAAWITALYPQLVLLDGSLMSENIYVLIVATILFGVLRARSAESQRLRWRWWTLTSVMVGLAVMTRSEAWLLVPLLLIPLTRVEGDRRAWIRAAAVACAGAILMTSAWTIRNAIALHRFQPLTNNSGWLLPGANCDTTYSGKQIGSWNLLCIPEGLSENETDRSAQARTIGIEYVRDHAGELPAVLAARLGRTFGAWDIRTSLFIEHYEGRDYNWLWVAWYAWLILAPLAIVGAVVQRRNRRELWPLLAPAVMVVIVTMLTYGNQRFRAAAEPSVIVLAAVGAVAGFRRVKLRVVNNSGSHEASPVQSR